MHRWKIAASLGLISSFGSVAAVAACGSSPTANATLTDYGMALRTLTQEKDATRDDQAEEVDAYYWYLKKGEFFETLMKEMRFDQNGVWTADFDPFAKILSLLNPAISLSITLEEEQNLLGPLFTYVNQQLSGFLEDILGSSTATWGHSIIWDSDAKKPVWKIEVLFPYGISKQSGSKLINDALDKWTATPAYTNGYLATAFGLFSDGENLCPISKVEGKSDLEVVIDRMYHLRWLDMWGYTLSRPTPQVVQAFGASAGPAGIYSLQWYLQQPSETPYPAYKDYEDRNRKGNVVTFEVSFIVV